MPLKGFKHTKETKRKISEMQMGRKQARETVEKRINTRRGYKHSKETIEKIRQSNVGKNLGKKQTLEAKIKQKQNQKGRIFSGETKRKISNSMKGDKNPSKRIEVKKKLSISHKGIETWNKGKTKEEFPQLAHSMSEETKQKISNGVKNAWRNDEKRKHMTENNKGKYKGGYRDDLGHYCRSRFEANYARFLKWFGMKYEYEPKVFELSDNDMYIPDFYLPEINMYIETKGYMRKDAEIKLDKFNKEYPDIKWNILFQSSDRWKQIVKDYSQNIADWEYDKREIALI